MSTEQHDKNRITLISVAAAMALTALKLVVGLLTGSLGLLSEAAHSGLDLVASILTFFSVRIASQPPDADHPYGHERVENLSATIQGLLLLATAAWIIYESIRRLFFVTVVVETSVWTFGVMALSIVIDLWRSRMLADAARRYHSRALEADALNFRADMLSSSVVILGLTLTAVGGRLEGGTWLVKSDAAAALVVALMIVFMSGRLAFQAISVLVDRAPIDLRDRMTLAAAAVPRVVTAEPVRLRESGSRLFADVVVRVARTTSFTETHAITEQVEAAIRDVEPRTETVVHVEPVAGATETAAERIRAIALQTGVATHHEVVHRVGDNLEASLHLEVEPELSLREAYAIGQQLVEALQQDNPMLQKVDTHIEVAIPDAVHWQEIPDPNAEVVAAFKQLVADAHVDAQCHEVRLYQAAHGRWGAIVHCDFAPTLLMSEIHRRTEHIEQALRQHFPDLEHVVIQAEPRAWTGIPGSELPTGGR